MAVEIKVPTLGESIVEATVGAWRKHEGDPITAGEVLVELETDKVTVEVTATESGVLSRILKPDGAVVTMGETLGVITATAEAPVAAQPHDGASGARVMATPVARRVAETQGVDIAAIPGSGPGGRVTKEDVLKRESAPRPTTATQAPPPPAPTPVPAPVSSEGRREERIRMSRRRQTIAARLVEAQRTAAMLTTFNEIDMSAVIELRKRHRDQFRERHGVGLGFMSFFTKAVIGALKAFPLLNAEIRGDEIIVKHYYDIGIAVSTDEGLVVPVLRDADRLSFAEIERGIEELARRARESKLTIADLQGGTFTITNGGIFGSLMSTPILNAPQVGILGMHKIQERPVALNGQVVIRPMMYVALSYDHRIVDGREAVSFLVRVKELVEDPERLLLEG
ncbi:MAG: 2-oxoglutarate dehydrogenase complex dihydrolipoyllysine-residue succinyltransferase [Roseiflexaceae bacterium]|nr:2-oxoglutarate dehydrogenase complex dihydrolipoyllysine-residue succinyltransferase [Roseiflexus sp.]MDW8213329.1 2-oxoglutarate dehydrogenase complex dihydrolipoyllysine-residue succinyltransferase [Roseiflexaceae bacterium]